MSEIFVVNMASGGYHTIQSSYYHRTESEAHVSFAECMEAVGDDPVSIELVRLNTETLDATTILGWEGTADDIDDISDDCDGYDGAENEEIMFGQP